MWNHLSNFKSNATKFPLSETNEVTCKVGLHASNTTLCKAPELPCLNQKILNVIQRILPNTQKDSISKTDHVFLPIGEMKEKVSAVNTLHQQSITLPSYATSPSTLFLSQSCNSTMFSFNRSTGSFANPNNNHASNAAVTNVFKLVPLARTIHQSNKNLAVLPLYDNFVEPQPSSARQITSKSKEGFDASRVHSYTISRMKLGCINNKSEVDCTLPPNTVTIVNKNLTQKVIPNNKMPRPNAIQSLLSAAHAIDSMSNLKSEEMTHNLSGMPNSASCAMNSPSHSNLKVFRQDTNVNFHYQPLRNSVGVLKDCVRHFDIIENVSLDAQQPLDFSIPKNTFANKDKTDMLSLSTDTCIIPRKEIDDDENALIVVDDIDDDLTIKGRLGSNVNVDSETVLDETTLKSEVSAQSIKHFMGETSSIPLRDSDHPELARCKRQRKRKQLLLDDEFYLC